MLSIKYLQDILVASSLSFGGGDSGHHQTGMSPGKVISDLSNHRRSDDSGGGGGEEIRQFTPSEFVSSTVRSSQKSSSTEPSLRKGTVENIPVHRPTLPPVVKTSKMKIESGRHPAYLDHLNSISSTHNPPLQTTFKTSHLRGHGQYQQAKEQQKYNKNFLQTIIKDFYEEPTRSREEGGAEDFVRSGYSKHYAPSSPGFYPRQREPYPYKNIPRPLSYRSPSRPGPPRGRYPPRQFDREDMMGNKMDNLKHIDGFLEDQSSSPLREFPHNSHLNMRNHRDGVEPSQVRSTTPPPPVPPPTTKSAKIQALTLKQLSAGLSVTTERADSERRQEGVTRDYTVFDMADAVTVTHPPPLQEERLDNHRPGGGESGGLKAQQVQRPHFKTYSETAPLRISTQEAGGKFVVMIVCFPSFLISPTIQNWRTSTPSGRTTSSTTRAPPRPTITRRSCWWT